MVVTDIRGPKPRFCKTLSLNDVLDFKPLRIALCLRYDNRGGYLLLLST